MTQENKIVTNNRPRAIIDSWWLTADERTEFDYINWTNVDAGNEIVSFFRYRDKLYDLAEFSRDYGITRGSGLPEHLSEWDAYMSLDVFNAMVIRYVDDESVIVGYIYS